MHYCLVLQTTAPLAGRVCCWPPACHAAGSTTELWGWHVARVEAAQPPRPVPRMRRVVSSWFRVEEEEEEEEEGPAAEADGGGGSSRGESDA